MRPRRQEVCLLATQILGPGKLRMLGEGEYFWIAHNTGIPTHLGWNLALAKKKLVILADPGRSSETAQA